MTIVNFALLDEHNAVVAVDTRTVVLAPQPNAGHVYESTKMHVLTHLGAVLTGSGRSCDVDVVATWLRSCDSFDHAASGLGYLVDRAWDFCKRVYPDVPRGPHRVVLIGPSASRGRMAAVQALRESDDAAVDVRELAWGVAPDNELAPLVRGLLKTDAGAMELARAQVATTPETPTFVRGGHLIVTRLAMKPVLRMDLRDLGEI